MTGRTHDLAAFTGLSIAFALLAPVSMSAATLVTAFIANMIGGLLPDIDERSGSIWRKVRGGSFVSPFVVPLFGGHRNVSHSLIGFVGVAVLLHFFLQYLHTILLVDMTIIWWAFMIGYTSHLFTDMLTKDGIPFFFPLSIDIGFPPIRALRIKTGGIIETLLVFPGLILLNGYIFTSQYSKVVEFFRHSVQF